MFLEIFIYLVIAFGTLVLCITMIEKDDYIYEKYIVVQNNKTKIKVVVETEGLDEDDMRKMEYIIRNGKYQNIYDIAGEFEVVANDNISK